MKPRGRRARSEERGYALLMAIFFLALLVLATGVAAPRILTEGKREKEQEMIWRGKQYERGIKLYYRKMGRFPTSIDDLTKPANGGVRFMRQAYKDPMNKEDGSWRLIYVGPSGQLIGSLRPHENLRLPGPGITSAAAAAAASRNLGGPASQPGGLIAPPGATVAPAAANAVSSEVSATLSPEAQPNPEAVAQIAAENATGDLTSAQTADTPTIIGGNIIGVGSKINKKSVIIFEKARNYRLFEFIWDPSKDPITIGGGNAGQIGTPANPNAPAAQPNPFGQQPTPLQGNPPPAATPPQGTPPPEGTNPQQPAPPPDSNPPSQ
jgi:hypothetical protein